MLTNIKEIEDWFDYMKIKNFHVHDNGVVDVDDTIDIANEKLTEIPLQFGQVTGNFDCDLNELTSLKGAPHTVLGYFSCQYNLLTNLEYAPQKVYENFNCSYNQLKNLVGSPTFIEKNFIATHNALTTLESGPTFVKGMIELQHNKLTNLKGMQNEAFFVNVSYNKLNSLEGIPKKLEGLICDHNLLTEMDYVPDEIYTHLSVDYLGLNEMKKLIYCSIYEDISLHKAEHLIASDSILLGKNENYAEIKFASFKHYLQSILEKEFLEQQLDQEISHLNKKIKI